MTAGTTPGNKSLPCAVSDAQARSGSATITLVVEGPPTAIHDIQGASHISPVNGQVVSTNGIVTARSGNGFWMQDPAPDANDATSEGIFVFTSSRADGLRRGRGARERHACRSSGPAVQPART